MKTLVLIMLLIISMVSLTRAQFIKVGGGLTYGTGFHFNNEKTGLEGDLQKSPFAGIFLTGIYKLNLPFQIAPSFTFFLPRTNKTTQPYSNDTRVSSLMFDLNGHYMFNSMARFEFYGLAGFDITFAKSKLVGTSFSGSDNALGLNLGAGTYIKITDQIDLFAEGKFILSKYSQFMLNAGILLNIDWMKKHENPDL
jgi:opacity protein-like surface antigen